MKDDKIVTKQSKKLWAGGKRTSASGYYFCRKFLHLGLYKRWANRTVNSNPRCWRIWNKTPNSQVNTFRLFIFLLLIIHRKWLRISSDFTCFNRNVYVCIEQLATLRSLVAVPYLMQRTLSFRILGKHYSKPAAWNLVETCALAHYFQSN